MTTLQLRWPDARRVLAALTLCTLPFAATPAGAEAQSGAALVTVTEARAASGGAPMRLTGTVTTPHYAQLSPQVTGLVAIIQVDAGDRVRSGQTLLKLDDQLAKLELQRAQAAVAQGQAQWQEAQRLQREAEELTRHEKLLSETVVRARASATQIAQAELETLQAQAQYQAAVVAQHRLTAPFDGVIALRHVDVGEWLATGTAAFDLVATDALRMDVQAPQEQIGQIVPGDRARVQLDAYPGRDFPAHVATVVPVSSRESRSFLVRLQFDRAYPELAPGLSAVAQFSLGAGTQVVLLPRDAVLRQPDGSTQVWVVIEQRAQTRQIRLGRSFADRVEVLSGIQAGEIVVVRGNEGLQENQLVTIGGRS